MSDEVTGRARGGKARAERLSPEQRREIASEAAKKRWSQRAETSGGARVLEGYSAVVNIGGMKFPCAVIEGPDGNVMRVLSENGITNAILGSRSGASKRLKKAAEEGGALVPLFLAPSQLRPSRPSTTSTATARSAHTTLASCRACATSG
jgi:hypothetical protein